MPEEQPHRPSEDRPAEHPSTGHRPPAPRESGSPDSGAPEAGLQDPAPQEAEDRSRRPDIRAARTEKNLRRLVLLLVVLVPALYFLVHSFS